MGELDDAEEGVALVRPFALVRGRATRGGVRLPVETRLATTPSGQTASGLERRSRSLLDLCVEQAIPLAEVAGRLDLPLGVVRVLVTDLVENGYLKVVDEAMSATGPGGVNDLALLKKVLDHVQRL